MSQDPNLWFIRGTIHNADGSVFHNQGRILAYQFDFNFKSDKFSFFEGAGLDSSWHLTIDDSELTSIDDVVLYISFTAKNS